MNTSTNYGRSLMLVASALDDHDTWLRIPMRKYGCLRGLQPSPANHCCPPGALSCSVRPRLAHVTMDGCGTARKMLRSLRMGDVLELGPLGVTAPLQNPGRRHDLWALPGLHSGAVAPSGPSTGTSPDEFTAPMNVLLAICTNYSRN